MALRRIVTTLLVLGLIGVSLQAQIHFPGLGGGGGTPKPAAPPTATPAPTASTPPPATPAASTPTPVPDAPVAPKAPAPIAAEPKGTASFDYYVLSLSWAPAFCSDPANAAANPKECAPGRHMGFVGHGLWPEANGGPSPEACEKTKPVSRGVLNMMAPYMPSPVLVQQDWATHGTCSGLTPGDYFTLLIEARVAVQLPVQITAVDEITAESPEQIEAQFAGANPAFPAKAFRTACKGGQFTEIRVCFDKALKGVECTATVGECADGSERILPPR